jgi:hypothetical protein
LSPHSDALELPHPDLTDGWIVLPVSDSADAAELVATVPGPDPGNAGLPRRGSAEEAKGWIARLRTRLAERLALSALKAYALLAVALSGCASGAPTATAHGTTPHGTTPEPLVCVQLSPTLTCSYVGTGRFTVVHIGRFTVGFDPSVTRSADASGVSLVRDVTTDLTRIAALLPGPSSVIIIEQTANVTPETGELGYTDPTTGQVLIQLDPISQVPFSETLAVWLPEALAHEIHHSVRTLTGPGFGNTLGEFLVSEGMASAFFHQAFPGTDAPWDNALTPVREHAFWNQAQPLLTQGGLTVYSQWFYGGDGVPKWAGFTIGYHIAEEYIQHHPGTSAASLVDAPAATILAGSAYAP